MMEGTHLGTQIWVIPADQIIEIWPKTYMLQGPLARGRLGRRNLPNPNFVLLCE